MTGRGLVHFSAVKLLWREKRRPKIWTRPLPARPRRPPVFLVPLDTFDVHWKAHGLIGQYAIFDKGLPALVLLFLAALRGGKNHATVQSNASIGNRSQGTVPRRPVNAYEGHLT